MHEPTKPVENPPIESETGRKEVELDDSELQKIDGGAFDAYLNFPATPK